MITIYHGEDIAKSRKDFIDKRVTTPDAITLLGSTMMLPEVMQLFEGGDLFASEKHIFIEDFFSKKKASKETTAITAIINDHREDTQIYFWEGKDLTAKQVKQFPQATSKQYKLPQTLFVFLDSIHHHNANQMISLFHGALADQDASFLFAMIVRQFRLLIALKEPSQDLIEEVKRMAPWQKTKLEKQGGSFTQAELLSNYARLFALEKGMKTGTLSTSLEQAIDFFLLQL